MKQQKQIVLLVLLLVLGVGVWFWNSRQHPVPAAASIITAGYAPMTVENPAIQSWKIDRVRKTEYKSSGRDPFNAAPPPPLELPPNMKFYGYGTVPSGSSRRAFLTDGDEVYIVAEGDVFLGRYRITKIGNVTIEFEEVSSGRQGKTNLEDAGPKT